MCVCIGVILVRCAIVDISANERICEWTTCMYKHFFFSTAKANGKYEVERFFGGKKISGGILSKEKYF